jgi:predicted transcriptional regulator
MDKNIAFLDFFDYLVTNCKYPIESFPDGVEDVLESLRSRGVEKPLLTDSGVEILEYLQSLGDGTPVKAKDIAEGMGVSSRKVSGSMRKLVTDEFVEKFGQSPVSYALTTKGKEFDIENFKKEKITNE